MNEVTSPFRKTPAYRYIRASDKLPVEPVGEDPVCRVKLFNPTGTGTWYLASYDPETQVAWGVCELFEKEYGTVYLPELVAYRGRFGLPIERDIHYTPKKASELLAKGA